MITFFVIIGSINWHQSICSGLFVDETRQDVRRIQDGEACCDVAAESEDTCSVSGECRLGGVKYPRPTVPRRRGPSSSLLPMLHEQSAV
jgi:hypothetical protein